MTTWANDRSDARSSISATAARGSPAAPRCGAQPLLLAGEIFELPLVHGARERRPVIEIAFLHAAAVAADQHATSTAIGVEVLALHHRQVGAGRSAAGWKRVLAPPARHHARIEVLTGPQALADMAAEGRHVVAPALRQERVRSALARCTGWMSQSTIASFWLTVGSRTGMFMGPSLGSWFRAGRLANTERG